MSTQTFTLNELQALALKTRLYARRLDPQTQVKIEVKEDEVCVKDLEDVLIVKVNRTKKRVFH